MTSFFVRKASIFVRDVRVEDALDLLIHNHQLEKKILTDNTVLVYPNTPQILSPPYPPTAINNT